MIATYDVSTRHLVHILQSIAFQQHTGQLNVESVADERCEKGEIFFEHGETVFARTENETGETALSRMLKWKHVRCSFIEGNTAPGRMRWESGVRRAARVTGNLHQAEVEEAGNTPAVGIPAIPKNFRWIRPGTGPLPAIANTPIEKPGTHLGVHSIFIARESAKTVYILTTLERKERTVLMLLDGKRNVEEIAKLLRRSEVDIAKVLAHLLKKGYIECVEA